MSTEKELLETLRYVRAQASGRCIFAYSTLKSEKVKNMLQQIINLDEIEAIVKKHFDREDKHDTSGR